MKKLVLTLCLALSIQITISQSNTNISIDFNNINRTEALQKIERDLEFYFFYQDNWFDTTKFSKSYSNETIENILKDLLEGTSINYYISEKNIYLTNNSVVYNSLPKDFFKNNEALLNDENDRSTVFFNEYNTNSQNTNKNLITIGKQNKNSIEDSFTVSGYVLNGKTNKALQDVTVSISDKNIFTTTDSKGYFELIIPKGLNQINTNILGFQDSVENVLVYGNGSLDLFVFEESEQLDEVLINANRDENVTKTAVGLTKIEVQGIKTIPLVLGERDVLKVATSLPGISTTGEGSAGFNVRGGKIDQNLILLDDAVMYNSSHFLGFFSAINPFTTGSVDIYKGSIPSEFGGRLSSVFDIKTKAPNTEKFSGEGAIGPVTSNLALEIPIVKDKAALSTAFRATYSDWILKALDEESLKNSEASFYDGILKYQHQINENNSLKTTMYISNDKFSITSDSIFKYNNLIGSLKWDHTFNAKHNGELILNNSQYKYDIDYEGNLNRNFDFNYKINESQLKIRLKYLHSKKHKFNYGISSKLYSINPGNIEPRGNMSEIEALTIDKEKGLESAVFISDLFEVNDKLLFDIGLRYSYYASLGKSSQNVYQEGVPRDESSIIEVKEFDENEVVKTYGGTELRMSLRYLLSPSLSIKGSYNNTIQYLHLLSSNTTASPTDTWKLSDYNTKPQRATQYSLGLYKNINDKNLKISLEGFYKTMDDILDYKTGAELLLNENLETQLLSGKGKAYGVEFLIKKDEGKLNGWIGYSYSRSFVKLDSQLIQEQVNNGDYFPSNYDKPHDLSIVANYKLTHRYSISTNFSYQTGRPVTYPVGRFNFAGEEQILYSDRNSFRIPDYFRLDLGINIEGNHKIKKLAHSFWNISVYNVLGRNNPYSVFFVNENGKIQAYKTSVFSVPTPTITYNFKF